MSVTFPVLDDCYGYGVGNKESGMTLRDWFAGMALSGNIGKLVDSSDPKTIAQYAYALADAMLAERGGK
jgi:hypothetical protein